MLTTRELCAAVHRAREFRHQLVRWCAGAALTLLSCQDGLNSGPVLVGEADPSEWLTVVAHLTFA